MSIDKTMIIATFKQHPGGIVGFGCWWAWLLTALNSPLLFSNALVGTVPTSSLNLFAVLSGAVISFAFSYSIRKTPGRGFRRATTAGSAAALTLCTICTFYLDRLAVSQDIALIAIGIVIGIALSLLQIFWGACYFTRISGSAIGIVSASSFVFALIVSFLVLDKGAASVWLVSLLPLVSGALLMKSGSMGAETSEEAPRKRENRIPLPFNLVILMVLFGASFGVFRMLFLPSSVTASLSSFYYMAIVSTIPMAATLVLVVVLRKDSYLGIALTIALPFITLGIFVLSLFGSDNQSLELALINAGVRCVDIVMWIMVAHIAKQPGSSPFKVFGFGRGLSCIGALGGFILGSWHDITPSQSLSVSIFVLLLLLAASAFSVMRSQKNFPDQTEHPTAAPSHPSPMQNAVRRISDEYRLSARELEVLELLSAGRTVAYIADKLVVANSTVATHVHHIYRKLDVHNRQELLDFVEAYSRQQEAHPDP